MTTLVICTTCGYRQDQTDAERPGALLADLVEVTLARNASQGDAGAEAAGEPRIRVQRTQCLMACQRACSAALHQPGKYSYVFADLEPEIGSVEALLGYVREYRRSATGVVPYQRWPAGIKGHFAARIPPPIGD